MTTSTRASCALGCIVWLLGLLLPAAAWGQWQEHRARQGDGHGGWTTWPAWRQVLKYPDADHTMPFGLVRMDSGEVVLLCSREKTPRTGKRVIDPVVAFSKDDGATWSSFQPIPGTTGRPQYFEWLGGGRLSFITEVFDGAGGPQRLFSRDHGRTWTERVAHPPTKNGQSFGVEGNGWIDRDEHGQAQAILELGWHYAPGKSHPKDDATVVFRRSRDGGKTWTDEVAPPQWKFTATHNGKTWLRGVSEGAIVRAANGDLVAALRTDMPPRFFDGPNDDSLEGTGISISSDDGKTWSPMQILFDAGRHHANLQRLPDGRLVCTLIVRDDIRDGKLATHRRGCDALVSDDHGKTWNLDRRYELDGYDFLRADGYWVDGMSGHVAALALPDGHVLSVYGHYQLGSAVLIKWKPEPIRPAPKLGIQVGPRSEGVERLAADELSAYLGKLFGATARPTQGVPDDAEVVFLVGSPTTNPAVDEALGTGAWPKVSDQGIVRRNARIRGKPALVVGGGSPAATLWAVYDLVERWGVRFLLHGDVLPDRPVGFYLPSDVVREPALRTRQWRTVNDFACGPESWGLAEHRRVIDQLAKLRFNRLFLSLYPYQPFLDLKVKGVARRSASLWYNFHYPITADMPGRALFGSAAEFWNPDLPPPDHYAAFDAAGEKLIQGIIAHAKSRGMRCAMNVTLTEYPPEFAPLLTDSEKVKQLEAMTVVPGPKCPVDDPSVSELAAAVLRATLDRYPDVDYLLIGMPEHRQWVGEYERAWNALDRKYHLSARLSLSEALAAARRRSNYPGGAERAVQEVKGDIVLLYFYDRLLTERKALRETRRPDVTLVIDSVAEELAPILSRILPAGSEALHFVDYTPTRALSRREVLGRIPARDLPSSLIDTLHDDNVGLLPQLATGTLHEITQELLRHGWSGFSTRYWLIGDHDPCVAYLSRVAWDATAVPGEVARDQIRAVFGADCLDMMQTVFKEVEAATILLERDGLGFAFPVPGMMMKHWTPEPLPSGLVAVRSHYERALAAACTARRSSTPSGRAAADYWIGRLEFGIGYLDAVSALRQAATAERVGRKDDVVRQTELAHRAARAAIEAYARVAGDQSDRGAIAILAEYVDRPLQKKLAALTRK